METLRLHISRNFHCTPSDMRKSGIFAVFLNHIFEVRRPAHFQRKVLTILEKKLSLVFLRAKVKLDVSTCTIGHTQERSFGMYRLYHEVEVYKRFIYRGPKARGELIAYTPTTSCITGFYHAIPGSYIYACLYGNASLKGIKTR